MKNVCYKEGLILRVNSLVMLFFLSEVYIFILKQIRSTTFPLVFFGILYLSHQISLFGLPRYDFIFLAALAVQIVFLATRFETKSEFVVIVMFHIIGLILELFKTHPDIGSWSYPEPGWFKLFYVPLYSGFMYAAVASYLIQSWRAHEVKLTHYPPYILSIPLSIMIYLNFFTHHFIGDYRWYLMTAVVLVFGRTMVHFKITHQYYKIPLVLLFAFLGFLIWLAENISTFLGAWVYPDQQQVWTWVSFSKITSWFLLVIISFIIVADLKHMRGNWLK